MTTTKPPVVLMILDGWGISDRREGNAVHISGTPFLNRLKAEYPNTHLRCSGEAVGLPEGIMGNSEVGHLNIGAGRIVYQDLLRIDMAIREGTFSRNQVLNGIMDAVSDRGSSLHLVGLVSDGGVHSHINHIFALLDMARARGLEKVFVHAILDGRDTSPRGGVGYVSQLQDHIRKNGTGAVASICGRFYAMDRDNRWDRTEEAYRLYTAGKGVPETDPVAAVQHAYDREETDEFVRPVVIVDDGENPVATVRDGDGVVFFNFRADRARQITRAFTFDDFDHFDRSPRPDLCGYVCMTRYDETFDLPAAFPPVHLEKILGQVVSESGLRQLRIAETEKYAHVTYFFNGGEETPFPGEDRCLIPSPREVRTYDEKPAMSAPAVADEALSRLASEDYALIVLNFANMDMVGHTGVLDAAVEACKTVDRCVERIVAAVRDKGGAVMVTADHGNSEEMIDQKGGPHTAHTLNPVPFILVDDARKTVRLRPGILADIAPAILEIMGLPQPDEMTGTSLLKPEC